MNWEDKEMLCHQITAVRAILSLKLDAVRQGHQQGDESVLESSVEALLKAESLIRQLWHDCEEYEKDIRTLLMEI